MTSLWSRIVVFLADRRGANTIEYCLLAGMIALVIVGAVTQLGASANGSFETLSSRVWGA